jgi:hypothetical protein
MNSSPDAWLRQARIDATPPSDLFDPSDAEQALSTAEQVIRFLDALDGEPPQA